MPSKHRISINLSEREYWELSSLFKQYNVSMAWRGRMAIEELLEKIEKEQVQPPLKLFPKKLTAKAEGESCARPQRQNSHPE